MISASDALGMTVALSESLSDRQRAIVTYEEYMAGKHPLTFATSEFRQKFGDLLQNLVDNYCPLVVNAKAERMVVKGFRFGEDEWDKDAWRIWQANQLDKFSRMAHKTAMADRVAYATVWPNEKDPSTPRIAIEHPLQMIVDYEPGDRTTRTAALKRWKGADGALYATLYLPDSIWRWKTTSKVDGDPRSAQLTWVGRDGTPVDQVQPIVNPFGVVPVVPLPNDPGLLVEGTSELDVVIPLQNVINKLWHDLIVASEFGAFRQRLLSGVEVPLDPDTNQPVDGWKPDISRILLTENEGAKGYTFDATDLSQFIKAIDQAVGELAVKSRTPPHYLNASADRLSGESIKSSETGLISTVREKLEYFGEGWEEVMRLAFRMAGANDKASVVDAQTLWVDPESRTEAEHADAVGKLREMLDVPRRKAWELWGFTPSEIEDMERQAASESLLSTALDLSNLDV